MPDPQNKQFNSRLLNLGRSNPEERTPLLPTTNPETRPQPSTTSQTTINTIVSNVNEAASSMHETIRKIIQRGQELTQLRQSANGLDNLGTMFMRRGQAIEAGTWLDSYKVVIWKVFLFALTAMAFF
ncbi:hypothetical protein HK098_004139, partial [Nowakowskiella sp. JEL0407]